MSTPSPHQLIALLNPISDEQAAGIVSDETFAELARTIITTDVPATAASRRLTLPRRPAALLLPAGVVGGLVVLALAIFGTFSNTAPVEPPAAAAAVLRGAAAALAQPPGSITIEAYSTVTRINPPRQRPAPGQKQAHGIQTFRSSQRWVMQTTTVNGPENSLNLGGAGAPDGFQIGVVNGNNELYDPHNNTVYISSRYGSDITPGPRPGTYLYTQPHIPGYPFVKGQAPLRITAKQRQDLLDGSAVVADNAGSGPHPAIYLTVVPASRQTSPIDQIRTLLKEHKLRIDGTTKVNGREAIKLTNGRRGFQYDVAPRTYEPIRAISGDQQTTDTVTWSEYRVLPATPANQQLLNLAAQHPGARIDRNPKDFQAIQARLNRNG
jgi:hypothetical protein